MSLPILLARAQAAVRRRRIAALALHAWPPLLLAASVLWRWHDARSAAVLLGFSLLAWLVFAVRRWRAVDGTWLVRRLDERDRAMQDSSDLLLADAADLSPLQTLQRARIADRLRNHTPDLRDPLPRATHWFAALLLLAASVAVLAWPRHIALPPAAQTAAIAPPPAMVQSMQTQLTITPPAHTGLPQRIVDTPDARAPQDSTFAWALRFAVPPRAVHLRFVDGANLELTNDAGQWRGTRTLAASALYRIEIDGDALPDTDDTPHRIDIDPDLAPQLRILEPERTLTVLDAAAPRWQLVAEAQDDHRLGRAELELVLAQGSGEQVSVSERRIALRGEGDARMRRYRHAIDPASLGFAQGDDLIARIVVRDERAPQPNIVRSPSYILRWPASGGMDGTGVEGLVQQAMPAYFRSQRQIIIDTEALLAEQPSLDADTLLARSDRLGVDQRILRLRYGQFLGEESESGNTPPPRDTDEHAHDDDAHEGDTHEHADAHDEHTAQGHDGHDHEPPAGTATAKELMAAAGHLHDLPEAATLLDPATRDLLRGAIAAMWAAEGELRSGRPAAALPHEYRALDFIKRVQQADRIYLARTGLELPQLDMTRRLSGTRPTTPPRDPLAGSASDVEAPEALWNALQQDVDLPIDAFATWLQDNTERVADPLAVLGIVDSLRRDTGCESCRVQLASALWPLLTPPAATPTPRRRFDAVEQAWLDAQQREGASP